MKTLITYATRHGATAGSAETLGDELRVKYGHDVRVISAEKAKTDDLAWADRIVIGSSITKGNWKKSGVRLLKQAAKYDKPIAVFVSAAVVLDENTPPEKILETETAEEFDRIGYAVEHFIDPVCSKFGIKPFAKAAFGGILSIFGKTVIDNRSEAPVRAWAQALTQ